MGVRTMIQRWLSRMYVFGLVISSSYLMLDTFVLERVGNSGIVLPSVSESSQLDMSSSEFEPSTSEVPSSIQPIPTFTEFGYEDESMTLSIDVIRRFDTQVYVAILQTTNPSLIKSAFGWDTYGKNIR